MKKVFVFMAIVVLLLAGVLVFAKGNTSPSTYLNDRGMTVMDENEVYSAFGTTDVGGGAFDSWFPDESYSIYAYVSYSNLPMIVYKYKGVTYLAVEKEALQGYGTMSASTVRNIYADFCRNYKFDIMMASGDGYNIQICAENSNTYAEMEDFLECQNDSSVSTLHRNKGEFIKAVNNLSL